MISAILSCLALTAPFGIGHIDRHGNEQRVHPVTQIGRTISDSLPPRSFVTDEAVDPGHFLTINRVQVVNGSFLHRRFHTDHYNYGRIVTFDGRTVTNYSFTRWVNLYGHIGR